MSLKKAEQLAYNLWSQVGNSVPVDVFEVARLLQLSVLMQEMEDSVSGMLVIDASEGIVAINNSHHRNRQRFTLAHEIGHFLLHRHASPVFVDGSPAFYRNTASAEGIHAEEVEANGFAAALLLPEEALREAVGERPVDVFDDAEICRLAERFEVSTQAMTIRLTRLGLLSV